MNNEKIENIVFYTITSGTSKTKQATVFYKDGTIRNASFEEGIDLCEKIAKERSIQTKDAFKELINNNIVHIMTEEDFKRRFQSFIPQVKPMDISSNNESETDEKFDTTDEYEDVYSNSDHHVEPSFDDEENDDDYDYSEEDDPNNIYEDENEGKEEKKEGFFKRMGKKIKKSRIIKGTIAGVITLGLALGLYSCAKKQTKEGKMANSNIPTSSTTTINNNNNANDNLVLDYETGGYVNASFMNDARIKSLLEQTSNDTQKNAMINTGKTLDSFNNVFAYYSRENGKDIKPALKFDEVIALQVAYNNYSRDQLVSIFNGNEINAANLSRIYKDANLQLMGAYVIETPEHPINMSLLIDSQEGKDFYKKYHNAFMAIKTAKDDEKVKYATEFYKMVRQDFPVTQNVRTEGISHSENYDSITPYKLAVTPIIAAAEMMWQNLKTDVTLSNMEVDFINDLGLCNQANRIFERAEMISLSNAGNNNNPKYLEYKAAYESYYKTHNIYYIDDAHRELTKLQAFQDGVNWHFQTNVTPAKVSGSKTTGTKTTTKKKTYRKKTTKTTSKTTRTQKPITAAAKKQVDDQLAKENANAKAAGEKAAEVERQRLQAIEDKNAAIIEAEVKQDEADFQARIDSANQTITNNHSDNNPANDKPVNESDLGHGTKFDDQHSDGNGNLNPSVGNITTDPTGDKTNDPLPDPNETGQIFDAKANSVSSTGNTNNDTNTDSNTGSDDYYYEEAWIEFEDNDNKNDYSVAVNSYVESLANNPIEGSDGYQYTK